MVISFRCGGARRGSTRSGGAGSLLLKAVVHSRRLQRADHAALVALVARVLEESQIRASHRVSSCPRLRPDGWIVHGEPVFDRVRVDAREPLDQMQVLI